MNELKPCPHCGRDVDIVEIAPHKHSFATFMPDHPLEKWQIEDAARLKALFENREPKVSQVAFASDHDIGTTQGIVWQYLNGKIPLNLDVAVKFAKGLKCEKSATSAHVLPANGRFSAHINPEARYRMISTRMKFTRYSATSNS